jgi:SAM-dependent methyltransferase
MHIDIAKEYELRYWRKTKGKSYIDRANTMMSMFEYPLDAKIVADVGCGPRGGFFRHLKVGYPTMYAVDPLWEEYSKNGLMEHIEGVAPIVGYADNFKLPYKQKADFIVSFNALDHSGNLEKSILNIMDNIRDGGSFFLHVHMRTKEQLNPGHQMLFDEHDLDRIFAPFTIVSRRIADECPLDHKPYRSYIAQIRK